MVLMEKDGTKKYVPDIFIDEHRSKGYKPVGETEADEVVEKAEEHTSEEVQPRRASTTKKRKS